jgi:hypothetical protein
MKNLTLVKIKKLAWVQIAEGVWKADALGGYFQVHEFPKGCAVSWIFGNCARRISDHVGTSFQHAQRLAQNDFDAIITASLL